MTNADYGAGFGDYRGFAPRLKAERPQPGQGRGGLNPRGMAQGAPAYDGQVHSQRFHSGQVQNRQGQDAHPYDAHPWQAPPEPHPARAPLAAGVSRGQRFVNIAGAAGSVALIASLAFWGWELAVRDVRGVPVVRAMEGPMRVAPEGPGGLVVSHQGLAVNDVAARDGGSGSDSVRLAPAAVDLAAEDVAGLVPGDIASMSAPGSTPADLVPVTRMSAAEESPVPLEVSPEEMAASAALPGAEAAPPVISQDEAVALALAEALGMDDAASADLVAQAAPAAPAGAMTTSPRPRPRPGTMVAGAAGVAGGALPGNITPTAAIGDGGTAGRKDPATIETGSRLVQFGAFDSEALAEAEWQKIAAKLGPLMVGKAMVVQSAESGGHIFWRLRGFGFTSEDDARRFCSAAVAEQINCIPVTHR